MCIPIEFDRRRTVHSHAPLPVSRVASAFLMPPHSLTLRRRSEGKTATASKNGSSGNERIVEFKLIDFGFRHAWKAMGQEIEIGVVPLAGPSGHLLYGGQSAAVSELGPPLLAATARPSGSELPWLSPRRKHLTCLPSNNFRPLFPMWSDETARERGMFYLARSQGKTTKLRCFLRQL
jgi:hypothetical protein